MHTNQICAFVIYFITLRFQFFLKNLLTTNLMRFPQTSSDTIPSSAPIVHSVS